MKQFFKFFFASLLGSFFSFVVIFFIFIGLIASIISLSEQDAVTIHPNSVLHIRLNKPVYDRSPNDPFSGFDFGDFSFTETPGLDDILKCIDKARHDENIKGILLEIDYVPAGLSTIQEIRGALEAFGQEGKFVVGYSSLFTQAAYYLGSVADEIYLNPDGMIMFKGMNIEIMFLKGIIDKLEINAQIIRSGKYKSAVEPFTREGLSKENREQLLELINSQWNQVLLDVSKSRNISIYDLNLVADNLELFNADAALKHGYVDGLIYKDELIEMLKEKTGTEKEGKIKTIALEKYIYAKDVRKKEFTRDKIAVLYALGEISMMGEDFDEVNAHSFAKAIRKAREDKNVKAIVMRVNSPGGEALASEIIRREVFLASEEKPVVVSMGDVAASGGYWISCNADKIFADQTTITGSIGVFGIIPDFKDFFNNKLGITFDNVSTNENADFISVTKPLTPFQEAVVADEIDKIYEKFITLVSEGRKLSKSHVDSIAQGKIWSGTDAKRIGLVDEIGGFEAALNEAAKLAGIEAYTIEELPELKDPLEELFKTTLDENSTKAISNALGQNYKYFTVINRVSKMNGIQARLPFFFEVE